jgi:hypothetical protein
MADKMKIPFANPDGSMSQEIGTLMEVTDTKEPWSEYTLEDGTKIRSRQAVLNIIRLDNKKSINNEPVYVVQAQQTMSVIPKI